MFMLKLSEQQKQYSRVQGRLPNVLKVRHILLAETASTSSIYNSQTARHYFLICNKLQKPTHTRLSNTHTLFEHQEQQHISIYKSFEVVDIQYTRSL